MSFGFLIQEYTIDNYRRMIQQRRIQYAIVFAICIHIGAPFGKHFVLSTLVSQPPMVAGPSTLFPLFVNGYHADGIFQTE